MDFEQILSDYKAVGGLMLPHSIEAWPKGAQTLRGRLDDAVRRFGTLTDERQLTPLNRALESAGRAPLRLLSEEAWRTRSERGAGS
jgi:hypothetical protein